MAKLGTTLAAIASLAFGAWFLAVEFESAGISIALALISMSVVLSLFAASKATASSLPKESRYAGWIALVLAVLAFVYVFYRSAVGDWSSVSLGYIAVLWLLLQIPLLLALVRASTFFPAVDFVQRMKQQALEPSEYRAGLFGPLVEQLSTVLKVPLDFEVRDETITVGSASCVATQTDSVLGAARVQVRIGIDVDANSTNTATADVLLFSNGVRLKCQSEKAGDFVRFIWKAEGESKQWESEGWLPDSTGAYENT
jgi:hypothetical protein